MPHIGILNALSAGLNQALIAISESPIEILPDPEPEIEEKKRKLLFNILPTEEEKGTSEFEAIAQTMIRKIGMTPNYKLKHAMFKKMLLRLITNFYDDRGKDMNNKLEFGVFVFSTLMKKYMMKKAAQNRFKHLLSSCMKYKSISRVRIFGRFIGLYGIFDLNDLNLYVTSAQTLKAGLTGKAFTNLESSERHFTNYSRCMECVKLLSKTLPKAEVTEITHKIEIIKINDTVNRTTVIDVDEFLEIIIEKYHFHKSEAYNFVKLIYEAGDVIFN